MSALGLGRAGPWDWAVSHIRPLYVFGGRDEGERLQSGARFTVPGYITVRGTVSAVELRQHPIDATTNLTVAEINFRESPPAAGGKYPEFNVCTDRLDVLQELFGADYRTSMIGKTIEVQGKPEGLCWGQAGEIQIFLARQVRSVPHPRSVPRTLTDY